MQQQAFTGKNRMLKGGLHCHTTRSDGKGTREEVIAKHVQNGYDFLALTDHWRIGSESEEFHQPADHDRSRRGDRPQYRRRRPRALLPYGVYRPRRGQRIYAGRAV